MCGFSSLIHVLPLIFENKKFISGTQPILCQQLIQDQCDYKDELDIKMSQSRDIGNWFAKPINSKE
jgi:hypothetical protein